MSKRKLTPEKQDAIHRKDSIREVPILSDSVVYYPMLVTDSAPCVIATPVSKHILILDDNQDRHQYYQRFYAADQVVSSLTYLHFVEQLHTRVWDLVHLDHDLGDFQTADSYVDGWGHTREYNGMHAVQRILELPEDQQPRQVIIQSSNPSGGRAMLQDLQRAGIPTVWEPFSDSANHPPFSEEP